MGIVLVKGGLLHVQIQVGSDGWWACTPYQSLYPSELCSQTNTHLWHFRLIGIYDSVGSLVLKDQWAKKDIEDIIFQLYELLGIQ